MNTTVDLLQIKIEKARAELSEESRRAIDAVDWKTVILGMRTEKGYSYAQLEDLELETELLLCGLLNPEDYPKELEKRMAIPKAKVDELVNEMNEKIFKVIRENLVKNINNSKISESKEVGEEPMESREEMIKSIESPTIVRDIEKPTDTIERLESEKELPAPTEEKKPEEKIPSILEQKLSGSFQIPKVETEHTLNNLSKDSESGETKLPQADPYRMPIE